MSNAQPSICHSLWLIGYIPRYCSSVVLEMWVKICFQYLESMRTDRKVIFESKANKEWHESEKKKKEKHEHYLQTQYNTTPRAVPVEDNEISS